MEYRRLGKSGLKVSAIGLGGNTFGNGADEAQTGRIVNRALDLGINFIDTADVYSRGISEEYVGKAVAGRRQEALIATKVQGRMGDLPNDEGLSRKHIMEGIEASLRRLDTDYVDLYQVHRFDSSTPIEETLSALDDLVRQGKVRYIGCSNFAAWQICESLWVAERKNVTPFVSVQPRYNIFDRAIERELVPFCRQYGIGIIPYSPLAGGVLTGKYHPGEEPPADTRAGRNARMRQQLNEATLGRVDRLVAWAKGRAHSGGELALAWLLAHPEVSTVIAGATRPEQVEENARASEWRLTEADLQEIDEILGPAPAA
ncbi:MAG TPA: aldo/keto reductase [Chloroflexota bacterium]|jgi:aryl-alcohol dehydrogenase-like predicted oxidoreductase|nr:aldo/keto reductase [Chloroflexota bacterium]